MENNAHYLLIKFRRNLYGSRGGRNEQIIEIAYPSTVGMLAVEGS
ncbi:hypothetical protein [Sphingobacterium zeae]|uniref:Uncharacterized protein n=1 Tax=Sphingobacterium zeae TaxID=1776859 RepID=A0ABU0U412_9SPHI|nr:hypothetical protein [Sphingobacterium zeae]MDQ1149707.1 hypothetical protein [Sphingobacterium zeae]